MLPRAPLPNNSRILTESFVRPIGCLRGLTMPILAVVICTVAALYPAYAQVYRVQEMNTTQIQSLDRLHTAAILVGGILEEHGPYLPSYTDGYVNEYIAQQVANAIAARPGWKVLMFPPIPLGTSGANDIPGKLRFPGTYDARESTLRAIFVDLASDLGDQGFRWIFVFHGHGAPTHRRALDEAASYFRAKYKGHMVNLWEISPPEEIERLQALIAAHGLDYSSEEGFSIHAGAIETSRLISVRPDLADPAYKGAHPLTGRTFSDLRRIGAASDWPGYFGSPRLSSKEFGDDWMRIVAQTEAEYALKILDGLDEQSVPQPKLFSGFFGFVLSPAFLWLIFALSLLWLLLVAHSMFRFREWRQMLGKQVDSVQKLLFRHILPPLLGVLAAISTVWILLRFGYTLWMLTLPPDSSYVLLLLACVTLLFALAKLITVAVVLVTARKSLT